MDQKKYYHRLVQRVLQYYGKECECCKEDTLEHLTLYDPDKTSQESRRQLLHRAIKNKDRSRYKILCHNCVTGYREQDECYHKK